jgi:CheY-like chemotaxis protein
MKVETHCNRCRTAYILDDAFAGTALPCPACGAQEGLVVPPARARASAGDSSVEPLPLATVGEDDTDDSQRIVSNDAVGEAAPGTVRAAPREPEEVVCPRCNLHFVPRTRSKETPQAGRPVVLVVEDMDFFREVAAEALASRFEIREASSVREARSALDAGGIDLILLDPSIEGGDSGIELLRRLPSKPCPILIYTDRDESEIYGESWEDLKRLGADDIVMKAMNAGEAIARKASGLVGIPWDDDE